VIEGYCDEPIDYEENLPRRRISTFTRATPKPKGRRCGRTNDQCVPHAAYADIFRQHQSGEMIASEIGKPYQLSAAGVRTLVKRCKEHPELLLVTK